MPRKQGGIVARTFQYFRKVDPADENCTKYYCEVEDEVGEKKKCDKEYEGKKPSNLTYHIKNVHLDFYMKYIKLEKDVVCVKSMAQRRLKFIQDRAELIAVNLKPFATLTASGFVGCSETDLNELTLAGKGEGLADSNHRIYKRYIHHAACRIREIITNEVKNKYVSVMTDITTKNNRSYLSIQIQFNNNNKIAIRSINIVPLEKKHTAYNLKASLFEQLSAFGITEKQLAAMVVDNGANFIAMVKLANETYASDNLEDEQSHIDEYDDLNIDQSNSRFQYDENQASFTENDIELAIIQAEAEHDSIVHLEDEEEYERLLQQLGNQLAVQTKYINGIRCGEHSFQLGVNDMLKTNCISNLMRIVKAVAVKLRTESYKNKLIENHISTKIPRLSCITRWNSDYLMV